MIKLLFAVLAVSQAPASTRLDDVSCLVTLTEDNRRPVGLVVADEEPKPFSALLRLQGSGGPGRVLACGVLHNIF